MCLLAYEFAIKAESTTIVDAHVEIDSKMISLSYVELYIVDPGCKLQRNPTHTSSVTRNSEAFGKKLDPTLAVGWILLLRCNVVVQVVQLQSQQLICLRDGDIVQ